jgi:hypothetical protein
MKGLRDFVFLIGFSYLIIGVIGLACKVWYLLFMFGWNLL